MTDKDLCIETEEIQTDGKDTYYCHRYEPTPYEVWMSYLLFTHRKKRMYSLTMGAAWDV